jgi:ABC-type bacteriocin/lantibiotic exporter with double-glycine peptidase domain
MPNLQNIFQSLTVISFQKDMLKKTLEILEQNQNDNINDNSFIKNNFDSIVFKNIDFGYEKNKTILNNINFRINKNDIVALIGESGVGKTTLVKIILGFLKPTKGKILLNNKVLNEDFVKFWQLNIAYLPQQIFILDESLIANIALSKNISSLEKKNIYSILKKLDLNYKGTNNISNKFTAKVGEDGKFFSGGQIQRIGIARAIFQKREFLILDESLNALDDKNFNLVINFLKKIDNITILIISHEKKVINICNKILEIKKGRIYESTKIK